MPFVQKIYFTTLSLCMLTLAIFMVSVSQVKNPKETNGPIYNNKQFLSNFIDKLPKTNLSSKYKPKVYHFKKPSLAKKVLSKLDVFEPVDDSYFVGRFRKKNQYDVPYLGLKNDDKYCAKHRAYFVKHPESVFLNKSFLLSEKPNSFFRSKIVPLVGADVNPHIGDHMPDIYKKQAVFNLKPETNIFWTKTAVNPYKHIGKHFSCLSQLSNHIPGHDMLSRKDFVAEAAIKYAKRFASRPQCFNDQKFFPKTWLLYNEKDCVAFFKMLNSTEYEKLKEKIGIVFIRKVAVFSHRGEGVQPVDQNEEDELRRDYMNGDLCGQVKKNYIIQKFIHNPLLINNRKFDFRMYMLIASTNPLMAYYHDGFLRVSLKTYDSHSGEKQALLTNLALNNQIYEDAKEGIYFEGKDEEALKRTQQWSFNQLQDYLLEQGIITDPNWLDNYLRPEFKKAMIHLLRLSADKFLADSSVYELYGVDFMLDEDLNLWFIEANAGPAFEGYSEPMEKFIVKMLKDHFDIVFGLLKSRMKRVVGYVNTLIDQGSVKSLNNGKKVKILGLKKKRREFKKIVVNYFEKEYEPKADNGFSKIIDESYPGVKRYQGYISRRCL